MNWAILSSPDKFFLFIFMIFGGFEPIKLYYSTQRCDMWSKQEMIELLYQSEYIILKKRCSSAIFTTNKTKFIRLFIGYWRMSVINQIV